MKLLKLIIVILFSTGLAITGTGNNAFAGSHNNTGDDIDTLFDIKDISHGVYAGPLFKYSRIGEEDGYFLGGRAGWIINHHLSLGVGGAWQLNHTGEEVPDGSGTEYADMHMRYGGAIVEYYFFPLNTISFSIGAEVGGGFIGDMEMHHHDDNDTNNDHVDHDGFFALEPGINLYINVIKYLRIGIGMSYRYVNGVRQYNLSDKDLGGPSVMLLITGGIF